MPESSSVALMLPDVTVSGSNGSPSGVVKEKSPISACPTRGSVSKDIRPPATAVPFSERATSKRGATLLLSAVSHAANRKTDRRRAKNGLNMVIGGKVVGNVTPHPQRHELRRIATGDEKVPFFTPAWWSVFGQSAFSQPIVVASTSLRSAQAPRSNLGRPPRYQRDCIVATLLAMKPM